MVGTRVPCLFLARGEVPGGDPPRGKLRTWSDLDGSSHKQRNEWRGSASSGTPPRALLAMMRIGLGARRERGPRFLGPVRLILLSLSPFEPPAMAKNKA